MGEVNLGQVLEFNADQLLHMSIFQQLIQILSGALVDEAITHDMTKFRAEEFRAFLENVNVCRESKTGNEEDYQKGYRSDGIQHHVHYSRHHPEYWSIRHLKMPFTDIIAMYFDWLSRTIQKGNTDTFYGFWDYNLEKLRNDQEHAIPIVKELRREFPPERFVLHKGRLQVRPTLLCTQKGTNFGPVKDNLYKDGTCPECGIPLGVIGSKSKDDKVEGEWIHP